MKKTCMNCNHYHGCLAEEDTYYHIHDYCDAWKISNEHPEYSIISEFLKSGVYDVSKDELPDGLTLEIYDDNETGEASCYRFNPINAPCWQSDSWYDYNFEHNKKLAIYILEKILRENRHIVQVYDDKLEQYIEAYQELNNEEKEEYQVLLNVIKELKNGN